jgi:hypothetical protein
MTTVDDGLGGALRALEGEGFAADTEIFVVGAGGYQDGVAGVGGVDAGLDCELVGGNVDDGGA